MFALACFVVHAGARGRDRLVISRGDGLGEVTAGNAGIDLPGENTGFGNRGFEVQGEAFPVLRCDHRGHLDAGLRRERLVAELGADVVVSDVACGAPETRLRINWRQNVSWRKSSTGRLICQRQVPPVARI